LVAARPHRDRGPGLEIVMQGRVGGRIYERTAEGVEHDWGEVTVWGPLEQLAYLCYLRQDRANASEVAIRFVAQGATATRVEIDHRGWERLGDAGDERRARNLVGWEAVLPHFRAVIARGAD
jgi:hypothetical protein